VLCAFLVFVWPFLAAAAGAGVAAGCRAGVLWTIAAAVAGSAVGVLVAKLLTAWLVPAGKAPPTSDPDPSRPVSRTDFPEGDTR